MAKDQLDIMFTAPHPDDLEIGSGGTIAKLAKTGCRIYEVGITYSGRTYQEGKKIGWRDGVWAIWCILKYSLLR